MTTTAILITVSGPDKPGLVNALAEVVANQGGNWLESRMANLGGQFAGIIRVGVSESRQEALLAAVSALDSSAMQVSLHAVLENPPPPSARALELELLGQDHPGIVRDISRVLSEAGVSVQTFDSWIEDASMAGGVLFHAHASLNLPDGLSTAELHEKLQMLSDSLMVEINLSEPEEQQQTTLA